MTPQVPAAVQAIFERSRDELECQVETLERAVAAVLEGKLDEDGQAGAERDAHKLTGSLGMFGLPLGSEVARELEHAFAVPDAPASSEAPRLRELVLALRNELDDPPAESGDEEQQPEPPVSDGRALLLVSPDPVLTEQLSGEALSRQLRPRSATSSAGARRLVATEPPDAAVLDLNFSGDDREGLQLLVDLAGNEPPVSVFVLTGSEALVDRVAVARRGGAGFIQRSRPASHVVDAVSETIERRYRPKAKLLAVDDDPAMSEALVALLAPVGLEITTLNDPRRFWEQLESVDPDLLVFDLDMPDLDGIDLCRAVRADVRFGQLPVLFLTAGADAECVQRIFEAGADDYVSKPIVGPELVTRIRNRLDRVHLYRELAERDGLTGLASRRKSTAALEDLVGLADRFGQPLSIALLDLDQFKKLNDRLGHATGDDALRRIGALLIEAFRGEDVVGRWGGEEFVVGMYGMNREDGVQRVAEVLEAFRAETFEGGAEGLTFSAGVAQYPDDGEDLESLYRAADGALYSAKGAGRDRVLPVGWHPDDGAGQVDVAVVEDDDLVAGVLENALKTRGYRLRRFADGAPALEALEGGLAARLVLLDVDLPGLDGLSVLRHMAEDGVLDRSRVIMLTANTGEAEIVEALELGAADHVAKPFSVPVLMQKVRRALADPGR